MKEPKKLSLQEEIEREAREIEKEISNHPELDAIHVTEEMDTALLAKIRAYEEEKAEEEAVRKKLEEKKNEKNVEFSEELMPDISAVKKTDVEMETAEDGKTSGGKSSGENVPMENESRETSHREKRVPYRRKKKRLLLVSLVAVFVLVLGAGMTSMGSKSYWKVLWEKIHGKESMQVINVEDMDEKDSEDGDEVTAYKKIDEILGISTVRIRYRPKEMWLDQCIIGENERDAKLFYKYNDDIIQYRIYENDNDSSLGIKEEDKKVNEYFVHTDKIDIKVEEFQVPEYSIYRQVANFEYQGVHYQLKGIIEKEEFEKILKDLYFL